MDTKMAIDAMNRHIGISRRPDKDFCLEMTQALTESYTSNNNAGQSDNKTEASCPYVASGMIKTIYFSKLIKKPPPLINQLREHI